MNVDAQVDFLRMRRRAAWRLRLLGASFALVVALVTLAAIGDFPALRPSELPRGGVSAKALFVNFGLGRGTLTRTLLVSLPGSFDQGVGPVAGVLNPRLQSDLRDGLDQQFPASQIELTATPVGSGLAQVAATLNAWAPQQISGGTYRGTIFLSSGSRTVAIPLVAYLVSRSGRLAVFAFLLLLAGAIIGLLVKWITEALTQLAAARWRLDDLRRELGEAPRDTLPMAAASKLEEIETKIMRQDTSALDAAFAPLIRDTRHLSAFAAAIRSVLREIDQQREIAWSLSPDESIDSDFVASVVQSEQNQIDRLRAQDWPWESPQLMIAEAQTFADQVHAATLALSDVARGQNHIRAASALELYRRGNFVKACELYNLPEPPEPAGGEQERSGRRRGLRSPAIFSEPRVQLAPWRLSLGRQGGVLQWMMKRPRQLAGAASVLVVATAGLQLQYLANTTFSGSLGDWLSLGLWSAIIELSGVSVLDVLGRLGTGSRIAPQASKGQDPGQPARPSSS